MSIVLDIPRVGKVEIQQFKYQSGRLGYVARKYGEDKEGVFFNLSVNIPGVFTGYVILKEYGDALLVNKFLMDSEIFQVKRDKLLGYNKIYYCKPPSRDWAK